MVYTYWFLCEHLSTHVRSCRGPGFPQLIRNFIDLLILHFTFFCLLPPRPLHCLYFHLSPSKPMIVFLLQFCSPFRPLQRRLNYIRVLILASLINSRETLNNCLKLSEFQFHEKWGSYYMEGCCGIRWDHTHTHLYLYLSLSISIYTLDERYVHMPTPNPNCCASLSPPSLCPSLHAAHHSPCLNPPVSEFPLSSFFFNRPQLNLHSLG